MPSLQIRNLSEEAYEALKTRAKADRRSIQQEAAWFLETMLSWTGGLHQPDWSRVDEIRERMSRRYGTLADSTPIIRQMRDER
jgi:plasmid stability protein